MAFDEGQPAPDFMTAKADGHTEEVLEAVRGLAG